MNENIKNTLWRTAVIVAIVAVATSVVGWLMRARFDATVNPIKEIRPSAWTGLGIGAMMIPVGFAAYVGLSYWFNRPGSATKENRTVRTIILAAAGLVMAVGGVLVASGDPFKTDHNKSIFWRGFGSGWLAFVAIIVVEYIVLNMVKRLAQPAVLTTAQADLVRIRAQRDRYRGRLKAAGLPTD